MAQALKVDRVEATICSESSLFHSRSSEGHDTLNNTNPCIWRWPNWPKGDCHTAHESCVETCVETGTSKDGSITGSINSVHAAGAHEIGVTPGISCDYLVGSSSKSAAHASSDNCQDPIELNHLVQLFVKLIDYPSISIQMECNASVSDMVKKALHKSGVYLPDSYVKVDGHIIAPDTVIIVSFRNATFTVSPRTRGGALDIPRSLSYEFKCVPLHDYLLGLGDSLFDVVRLRDSPCAPFVGDYFVSLGKSGRLVYKWLFSLVETFHAREKCLKTFTVEDIVYVREMGLVFYEPKEESFSQPGYRRNILNVGTILETYFRYSPSRLAAKGTEIHEMNKRQSQLPNHLHVLVQFIKDMPRCNAYEDGLTVVWRSIFLLDPTGMSAAAKIALMLSLDLKVKYLSNKQREDFDDALGKTENWKPLADAVPALKDVLNFRFFDRATRQYRTGYYDGTSLSSLWLLGRNYLSHSEKLQMDVKMAEAIFSFIFTYLLPLVIRALIRKYQNAAHPGAVQNSLTFRDILDME